MPAIITRFVFATALLACGATTVAAAPPPTPQVAGKYAFISTTFCEAKLTLVKDAMGKVIDANLAQSGMMSVAIGYISFTPTSGGAPDGTAAISNSILVEGGALRVGNSGFSWHQVNNNSPDAAYSFTGNSFTYNGQTYRMVYGAPETATGYFRSVYLIRRSTEGGNANCLETISATKQDPDVE